MNLSKDNIMDDTIQLTNNLQVQQQQQSADTMSAINNINLINNQFLASPDQDQASMARQKIKKQVSFSNLNPMIDNRERSPRHFQQTPVRKKKKQDVSGSYFMMD